MPQKPLNRSLDANLAFLDKMFGDEPRQQRPMAGKAEHQVSGDRVW